MALFNYATKEITIKIVYYGPGLSGKTTNLQYLHSIFDPSKRGKLLSLATEADRTLFFDFLPVELGKISDFSIRFQLYTVPGQVRYNATRKLVLKGADAIVYVADSQREMREQNIESLKNMHENLLANNINPNDIPVVLQYNKRDLTNISSADDMNKDLNENGKYDYKEAIAIDGNGVEDTFQHITRLVIKGISKKHNLEITSPNERVAPLYKEKYSEEPAVSKEAPEPEPAVPGFESSRYGAPEIEVQRSEYDEIPNITREPVRTVLEEETPAPKEVVVKEIREIKEVPIIPKEKLDAIVNGISEISQTLKEFKNSLSSIHNELKDVKKEQRETNGVLREMLSSIDNIKSKKSWFRFS